MVIRSVAIDHAWCRAVRTGGETLQMVLIVASQGNLQDPGMRQRIAAIDSLIISVPKRYLSVSLTRNRRREIRSPGQFEIDCVNLFWHYRYILRCFREASCVYVHHLSNAMRVLPFMRRFRAKTIVDVHGVMPEELDFLGKPIRAAICRLGERAVVRKCGLVIVVSHKMAGHFLRKYHGILDPSRIATLPVFDSCISQGRQATFAKSDSGKLQFVYAGGIQKWQNVDLILQTLDRLAAFGQNWQAGIYVPPEAVRLIKTRVSLLRCGNQMEVASLTHDELVIKYRESDIGFVLREANLLNQVATPTKLVEYITYGIVPVVLSPDIGDFVEYKYKYLTIQDLFDDSKVDRATLGMMRASNLRTLASIQASALEAKERIGLFFRRDAGAV